MTLFQLRVSAVTVELYTPNNAAWFQRLLILVTDLPGLTQMFFFLQEIGGMSNRRTVGYFNEFVR